VSRAISKYGDIIYEVMESFNSLEECKERERDLRPEENIGWNMAIGGGMPPRVTKETAMKISKTIKALRITPYCERTSSPEACQKREAAKRANKPQWWHDPETLEYKLVKTAKEEIPQGWVRGRKPKPKKNKLKVRGEDYVCNGKFWKLYINDELVFKGKNLKAYLRDNDLLNLYTYMSCAAKESRPFTRNDNTFRVIKIDFK
jgi:hypothetical protein